MDQVEFRVRSPTGLAWIVSAALVIAAGELYDDGVLTPVVIVVAIAAALAMIWLVSLYAAPGRLRIDAVSGTIERVRPSGLRRRAVSAPFAQWHVLLTYYREEDRLAGRFKRLQLRTPGLQEVLLYDDLARGETLAQVLSEHGVRLGRYEVRVERP